MSNTPNRPSLEMTFTGRPLVQPATRSGNNFDSPKLGIDLEIGKSKLIVLLPQMAIALDELERLALTPGSREMRSPGSIAPKANLILKFVIKDLGIPESDWLVAIKCTPKDLPLAAMASKVPIASGCDVMMAGNSSASTITLANSGNVSIDETPA